MGATLTVTSVAKAFGGVKAVSDFSLELPPGALHALIGPNGAGKTTCFNLLTGVYRPDSGSITLGGKSLVGKKPYAIAAAGLSRTFQNIRLFAQLTVLDNVRVACHMRASRSMASTIWRGARHAASERAISERASRMLELFGLSAKANDVATSLSYGEQRRLEMARALATEPHVLLLDEPVAGMNPSEKVALRDLIARIRHDFGVSILLIEHDMGLVMEICERITVLDHGVVIASGTPSEMQGDPKVIAAYLGEVA